MRFNEFTKQAVSEGYLDNPGQQDSPVASAITRRILLQRTDLLSKYGPEKVAAAVDEVADFVGDVDEIGSSDVSGWIRHVEQMLGNMGEGVAEGMAQDEAEEEYGGWRAELVNQINYNTFEVKLTNSRARESANFIIRPVDMVSYGPTLSIETMDVRDLQTGRTESWTNDDPAPQGPIAYAISALFYDDKQLQKKLWNIIDTHDTKGQDMLPGLEKRRSIGQEVGADAYVDSGKKTQAAMAKMKKGVAEAGSGRDSWDSNMPGYQGDYGGAENWGRRSREDDEHHEIDRKREEQLAQYNQTGKFWLKYKDSQKHVSAEPFIGKAAATAAAQQMIRAKPEVKGNLLITAYGPNGE